MFKTKIKKAHLFMVTEQRGKYVMPFLKRKPHRTVWQQVYMLLF